LTALMSASFIARMTRLPWYPEAVCCSCPQRALPVRAPHRTFAFLLRVRLGDVTIAAHCVATFTAESLHRTGKAPP
jgi:hypothetical protein